MALIASVAEEAAPDGAGAAAVGAGLGDCVRKKQLSESHAPCTSLQLGCTT